VKKVWESEDSRGENTFWTVSWVSIGVGWVVGGVVVEDRWIWDKGEGGWGYMFGGTGIACVGEGRFKMRGGLGDLQPRGVETLYHSNSIHSATVDRNKV
jgi:hypothetical protein